MFQASNLANKNRTENPQGFSAGKSEVNKPAIFYILYCK
ncbi:hypothetical protein ACIVBQ_002293 [Tenacibaculum discolor]